MAAKTALSPNKSASETLEEPIGAPERTIADVDRELAELRDAVLRLVARNQPPEAISGPDGAGPDGWHRHTSRRWLLKGASASLAAIAAAGVATGSRPRQVEATDGNAIIAGQKNQTRGTSIYDQPAAGTDPLFIVDQNNGTLTSTPPFTGGLRGIGGPDREGVDGYAPGQLGYGVYGASDSGYGVVGASGSGLDLACLGGGRFLIGAQSASGPPNLGTHGKGEIVVDSRGVPYVCESTGGPGTWNAVGNLRTFPNPRRVYANPSGINGTTYGPLSALTSSGVPAGALSAYCAVQSYQAGVMTLFPDGAADPGVANWSGTGTSGILNILYMLVPLSVAGDFRIHTYFNGSIYVDVWGYVL